MAYHEHISKVIPQIAETIKNTSQSSIEYIGHIIFGIQI